MHRRLVYITVLVTGATGRIGRHLVGELLKRNEKVKVLARSKEAARKLWGSRVAVTLGDMTDKDSLQRAARGANTIYHLAAVISPEQEGIMQEVNVDGTRNLLSYSKAERFIYMSSTAAMGRKLAEVPANEYTECRPSSLYGRTKLEAEQLVKAHNGIIIRAADVYGPGFEEGYFDVFRMLEQGKLPLIGSGKNFLQYVHVDDLMQALLLAKDKGRPGEVYIITGPEAWTQKMLFDYSAELLGVEPPGKSVPVWLAKLNARIKGRKDFLDYFDKLASSRTFITDKAKKELGYEPKVGYKEGLAGMVKLYKAKARPR